MGENVIGKVATVVSRVRGSAGPGEVCLLLGGTYETFLAYSDRVLDKGSQVLVVSTHSPGSYNVTPAAGSADPNPYIDPMPGLDANGVAGNN